MTDKQCPDEWESEDLPQPEENELTVWQPVARDLEFEKHIAKLKAMKQFNRHNFIVKKLQEEYKKLYQDS